MYKHYEIVFMIHPDHSFGLKDLIMKYKDILTTNNGKIHRLEDLGRRQLAHPIENLHKAHYILMNIECNLDSLNKISKDLRYNNAVLRRLIIKRKSAILDKSPLLKEIEENNKD